MICRKQTTNILAYVIRLQGGPSYEEERKKESWKLLLLSQ